MSILAERQGLVFFVIETASPLQQHWWWDDTARAYVQRNKSNCSRHPQRCFAINQYNLQE
jgi:hypothetical protein